MTKEELKQVLTQIKRYELTDAYKNEKELNNWLKKIKRKQISNFLNLNIDIELIKFPRELLVNLDLLNCNDYEKRIELMNKISVKDGLSNLLNNLCSPGFLNSDNYYEDMNKLSTMDDARYGLFVVSDDDFIKSPYHEEDLELILQEEKNLSGKQDVFSNERILSLVRLVENKDSIKSPYHREDMKLVASADIKSLGFHNAYPEFGINLLAENSASLKDKYHLENMQLLARNPLSNTYLYELMTTPSIIKDKNYREVVRIMVAAKSELKAKAMYFMITNKQGWRDIDVSWELNDLGYDFSQSHLYNRDNCIDGYLNKNYLKYLESINSVDDKYVFYMESIMSNKYSIASEYQDKDIELLKTIDDPNIIVSLYNVMTDKNSLNSKHHIKDLEIISQVKKRQNCSWLVQLATDLKNLESKYHRFDMEYVSKLDINHEFTSYIRQMLFDECGINDPHHIQKLEQLAKGIIPEEPDDVLNYVNDIENNIDNFVIPQEKPKRLTKLRKLLKRK